MHVSPKKESISHLLEKKSRTLKGEKEHTTTLSKENTHTHTSAACVCVSFEFLNAKMSVRAFFPIVAAAPTFAHTHMATSSGDVA